MTQTPGDDFPGGGRSSNKHKQFCGGVPQYHLPPPLFPPRMSESTSEPVTPPAAPTVHETPNIAAPPLTRSGSPPPPPPQLPGDTPIRRSLASHNPHVTDHTVFYETPFARAAEEMKDSYMEVDTLSILDLLPECTGMPEVEYGLFKAVGEEKTETRMYDPFVSGDD